jgi:hypothetical protein
MAERAAEAIAAFGFGPAERRVTSESAVRALVSALAGL